MLRLRDGGMHRAQALEPLLELGREAVVRLDLTDEKRVAATNDVRLLPAAPSTPVVHVEAATHNIKKIVVPGGCFSYETSECQPKLLFVLPL